MPKVVLTAPGNVSVGAIQGARTGSFDTVRALTGSNSFVQFNGYLQTKIMYLDSNDDSVQYHMYRSIIRYDFRAGFRQMGASSNTTLFSGQKGGKIRILKAFFVANDTFSTGDHNDYGDHITGSNLIPEGSVGSLIYVQRQSRAADPTDSNITNKLNYNLENFDDATLSGPTFVSASTGLATSVEDFRVNEIIPINNRLLLKQMETAINTQQYFKIGIREAHDVQNQDPITSVNTGSLTAIDIQSGFDHINHRFSALDAAIDNPLELHIIYKVYSPASKLGRSAFSGGDIKSIGGSGFGEI